MGRPPEVSPFVPAVIVDSVDLKLSPEGVFDIPEGSHVVDEGQRVVELV